MYSKSVQKPLFLGGILLLLGLMIIGAPLAATAQEPSGAQSAQATVSSAFTYQGYLSDGSGAVNGSCDFTFSLYDALSGGTQIGATLNASSVSVNNGDFSVDLDFGSGVFTGDARYLEISVDCGGGASALSPRQALNAVPYALGLHPGATIEGTNAVLTGIATGTTSNNRGLVGEVTSTSGSGQGVRGETASSNSQSIGVYGLATSVSAAGTGVKGQNNGTSGYGVWGQGGSGATGVLGQTGSGSNYGVWAYNSGSGVALRAESQSGSIIEGWDLSDAVTPKFVVSNSGQVTANGGLIVSGGSGDSVSLTGSGNVLTVASSGSNSVGVYGSSSSSSGRGVFGEATASTGSTSGVRGVTNSNSNGATGVYGLATSASATGTGVKGQNNGTSGYGVWGQGGSGATGVLGQTNSASRYGVWAYNSGSGAALRIDGVGNLIEAWDISPVNRRFYVSNAGDVRADGSFSSPAADFAEMLPANDNAVEAGDVLAIGPDGQLTRSSEAFQRTVAGVYSTQPGFVGGDSEDLSGKIPLAVVGVVPVKASAENGAIQPGDMLVASSTPGYAMRGGNTPPNGSVIGKALSGLGNGLGEIKMLVVLQ